MSDSAAASLPMMLLIVAMFGGAAWGIVNAVRCPAYLFESVGHSKGLWIVLQLLLFPLGSILFVLLVWPSLRRHNLQAKPPELRAAPGTIPGPVSGKDLGKESDKKLTWY